jgi:hypothetical protein
VRCARVEWAWKPETGSQPLPRGVYALVGAHRGACRRLPAWYHHRRAARAPDEPHVPLLSGKWRELGITGNVRSAAATASRLYWSRLELPTTPFNNSGEGADRPPARNSPRRTPQVARSAFDLSSSRTTSRGTWQSRNRMGLWREKARTGTHLVSGPLCGPDAITAAISCAFQRFCRVPRSLLVTT